MMNKKIKIIKEYIECDDEYHCIFRSNTYSSHLDFFNYLFKEAKSVFPELKMENANIVQYGGRSYKGTFGLEFSTKTKPPGDFLKRNEPELIL